MSAHFVDDETEARDVKKLAQTDYWLLCRRPGVEPGSPGFQPDTHAAIFVCW